MIRYASDNEEESLLRALDAQELEGMAGAGRREHRLERADGVLIIEPDDELALALADELEAAGFNVETVASMDEAHLALNGCHFEMVVFTSGIEQDDYNGLLSCLEGRPGTIRLPVPFATTSGQHAAATSAQDLGTAVLNGALAGFVEAMRAAILERKRLARSA